MNLREALKTAIVKSGAPGAVAYVGLGERTLFHGAAGYRILTPERREAQKDTIYDLASLTKVVATTTLAMMLRDEGKLDLDRPVSAVVPVRGFERFTPRHLMTHTSGLAPFKPWYKELRSLDEALMRIGALDLDSAPGTRRRYSDLGFMILGKMIELIEGDSLAGACRRRILDPLKMENTSFNPPKVWRKRCAATEQCPWRGKVMVGEVHDETAYAVGGVAGHAGLFSTAEDLGRFCRALLAGGLLKPETLAEMTKLGHVPSYPWQGLGWKMDPWMSGSEGYLPSRTAFGHTGFTGTCLWMDRESGLFAILLSNTCHPSRDTRDTKTLRSIFYTAVASEHGVGRTNAHTGLDRVVWDEFAPIAGKRLSVLTNHAAVDVLGRPLLDVFALCPQAHIVRLYSPEHGYQGQSEAGEKVGLEKAAIPVTSLYGDVRAPDPAELAKTDLFVVDLPDIGARYYTYLATMKHCMAACAQAKVPILVLDRPNPLGGVVLEGPIAERTDTDVCAAAIPARHGMTLGEAALWLEQHELANSKLALAVCAADNWLREYGHADCSLPWVPPSPNMPDAETALLYAGMCLFEGVNMNEGRGTDAPFRRIGAPWLDAEEVLDALGSDARAGIEAAPDTYIPRAILGKASHPEYEGQTCQGIRFSVKDTAKARPFLLAVSLLAAVRERHPKIFQFRPFFDTLAGGPGLREQIEQGVPPKRLVASFEPALLNFDRTRPKLYFTGPDYWKELLKSS